MREIFVILHEAAVPSLSLGQKYIKLGIVRVTLNNTKLH